MWPTTPTSIHLFSSPRNFLLSAGFVFLIVLIHLDYRQGGGWRLLDSPLDRFMVEVTTEQANSMIAENKIVAYGIRRHRILMANKEGKWFSVESSDDFALVKKLGQQQARYIAFSNRF